MLHHFLMNPFVFIPGFALAGLTTGFGAGYLFLSRRTNKGIFIAGVSLSVGICLWLLFGYGYASVLKEINAVFSAPATDH